jgi:hypothetical protein
MRRSRLTIADFEARSVQLIAACTLGLAGVAALPHANFSRTTGQASTHSTAPSKAGSTEAPRLVQRRPGA